MATLRSTALRFPPLIGQVGARALGAAMAVRGLGLYLRDRREYRELPGAEPIRWRDAQPMLADRTSLTPYDVHYLPQDAWAARRIAAAHPGRHVDVGSRVELACFLTAVTDVTFVDIRPLDIDLDRLDSVAGSVLDLPFDDESLESVSCLHVVEHVGLGRYGDPLDPMGSRKAMAELQRVLAPRGQLLFSLPVGRARVCFNAHRVHDPREIPELFSELVLEEFAGVDDEGAFRADLAPSDLADCRYGCGMYRFRRPG